MKGRSAATWIRRAWLVLAMGLAGAAQADSTRDVWRGEVAQTRLLAENKVPQAYAAAQRLLASLPADAQPTDKAWALNVLARAEIYLARTEDAAQHAQAALDLAQKNGDKVGQAEAELNRALSSVNQGKIDVLVTATTHGLAVLDGIDRPDLLGEALLRTTMMYRRTGQFEQSFTMALQALEIAKRSRNPWALTYAHQGLATAFQGSDRNAEAAMHYAAMREFARAAGSRLLEADALLGQGGQSELLGSLAKGESLIRESIALFQQAGSPFNLAFGLFGLAQNLRSQGRYAETLPLMDEVVRINESHHNPIGTWYSLNMRGQIKQSMGQHAAARTDIEQAYALARKIGLALYEGESARRMATLAADVGDYPQAYRFTQEAIQLMEKAAREKYGERMVELSKRYETEAAQREIAALTARAEKQAAELLQRELRQRWLWTVLGGSIVAFAGTVYFLLRLRRSNRLLESSNLELTRSRSDLQATLDAVPDPLFEMSLEGQYHSCHSQRADLLAAPRENLVGKMLSDVLAPEAAAICLAALQDAHKSGTSAGRQFELRLPHGAFWFELSVSRKTPHANQEPLFVMLSRDITERKRHEALEEIRMRVFEKLAQGTELTEILELVLRGVERLRPDFLGSIMRVSADGRQLLLAAAPTLPLEYRREIQQIPVEEHQGSCGSAAALGKMVVAEDIRTHPYWQHCNAATLHAGLMACWSAPIFDSVGILQGVFTLYLRQPSAPGPEDFLLLRQVAYLVATAMERKQVDATGRDMLHRLEESQQMLRQLAARNDAVREEERKHLARELHDELGQFLTALRLGLSVMELQFGKLSPLLQERTQHMIGVVDSTIKVARNVVTALRPTALDMGIEAALEWLSQEFTASAGVNCQVTECEGCAALDEVHAMAIFRIVQESLTNIGRHAQASHAEIRLSRQGQRFQLEVRDNGCGFDPELRKAQSFGLAGIQERVHMFGGEFAIHSIPGEGSCIRVGIPLSAHPMNESL